MMTLEEAAAIKTQTGEENGVVWDRFMELAPEGDFVPPENRAAVEELIKTAPFHMRREISGAIVLDGYFPWRREDGWLTFAIVSMRDDGDACVCDGDSWPKD